jgi:hypothetical protein
MPLPNPELKAVQAGGPVTADAWNAILTRILNTLPVRVTVDGDPFDGARVVAVADGGGEGAVAIEAVPPYSGVDSYTVVGVTAGTWKVFAFTGLVQADPVSVPVPDRYGPFVADWVSIHMPGHLMPDLTGMSVAQALARLGDVGVALDEKTDTVHDVQTGLSVNLDYFKTDPVYVDGARIGWHEPVPGELFDPARRRLRLFCGAPSGWTYVPAIDDGTSFDDAVSILRDAELHVSPASRAQHSQDPTTVVRATNPRPSWRVPNGAYVDLDLRAL